MANNSRTTIIVVTALMLFSMFFGAGNLIFPPMLGIGAGENFWPAIFGFLGAGVLLPVIAIIAIAMSGNSVRDLANRAGWIFGLIFPILAYLSIGAFYALPRTGAVAFETAATPLFGWDSMLASGLFNFAFFGVALALSWRPSTISSTLGKFLTPILVLLLVLLIAFSVMNFETIERSPSEDFVEAPMATGLLEGYLTMDAIAALAFGIVVISSLRYQGVKEGRPLVTGTIAAGIGAGILLALIYVGLGVIGQRLPGGEQFDNGANVLSEAANQTLGQPGQVVFALIVLLACLTTAVGLITATSEFFESLLPGVRYHIWAVIFALMSFSMATMGLDTVLAVAAPVISFIYPPAITLMFIALVEPAFRGRPHFYWTYRLPIWVAVIWSALTSLHSLGWGASIIEPLISWAPMQALSLGWVLPVIVTVVIAFVLDVVQKDRAPAERARVEA
ncbi:branched-chain amino acid transport system II carrier protein [Corynebacterium yudongzhengii]|uniref:Branched-chain amino acid transport system II carrier protein n=1 Tax=Corynebacterium yudongzhengii TaxID=2080740 RepID=A0A2U1T4F7_9CORY|nr:branched-chain amino acid transport system II carrier protein [Corynebacterium yudongzhengii]AWB82423.1 branched-chain amino acid transport system II carrier protein [Corynebacterium yudongzhengii]PWC00889.1 branched-chain amino acid transport system II carrier protein [Corynebacterium yudongzhengii]